MANHHLQELVEFLALGFVGAQLSTQGGDVHLVLVHGKPGAIAVVAVVPLSEALLLRRVGPRTISLRIDRVLGVVRLQAQLARSSIWSWRWLRRAALSISSRLLLGVLGASGPALGLQRAAPDGAILQATPEMHPYRRQQDGCYFMEDRLPWARVLARSTLTASAYVQRVYGEKKAAN